MVRKLKQKSKARPKVSKLDIACGDNKREGFTGIDKFKTPSVDIVHDLTVYPWPFEDSSIDEIYCNHYIEHVVDLCAFYSEIYRILKVGGTGTLLCPYGKNNRAWQDPTHVRALVEESFFYLDKNFREVNKLKHYLADVDFEFQVCYLGVDPLWANKSEEARTFAIRHYWNIVSDLQVNLKKR